MDIYESAANIAHEIETELKRLGRWMDNPLPEECYHDMGAFGSNTMSFEQWLQFILLPRIREIVSEKNDFPKGSNLATYAIRYFDGNTDSGLLQDILYTLDRLIQSQSQPVERETPEPIEDPELPSVSMGDTTIPAVLYSLAEVLPQYELRDLESQLQTFDTFLGILSPAARQVVSAMLIKAAIRTTNPECSKRIEQAARDVADGKRAALPYTHEEARKKYQEEHRKNFPS